MLIVLYFFSKNALVVDREKCQFYFHKKGKHKKEKKGAESKVGPANNSTQSIEPKLQLLCYSAHSSSDSMPRSSRLTGYHDDAYHGQMWQNKISSAIQHPRSDTSCGSCSHTQKMMLSDNTHHMISRQDATLSIAYEIMHPSSETMKSCTC
jgi:hypothetical protein